MLKIDLIPEYSERFLKLFAFTISFSLKKYMFLREK
jgi:hypothetical protein